jgi:hypothetical protein
VPRYWLDASVFIEANLRSYPIGIADSFWEWLAGQVQAGQIVSPRRVYKEVAENEDHQDLLAKWVKNRKDKGLCVLPTKAVQLLVGKIGEFVFSSYPGVEAYDFLRGGDPWVIAHALDDDGVVVTKESYRHPQAKKARIPDVCEHFGVSCIDTLEMLKRLKAKF